MVSGRIYVTNDQIVCGSREGTANVLYPQNSYIHPAEKQCNYSYTHPTTKQCNYSYTHPSTKQCNWTPDLSGYATNPSTAPTETLVFSKSWSGACSVSNRSSAWLNGASAWSVPSLPSTSIYTKYQFVYSLDFTINLNNYSSTRLTLEMHSQYSGSSNDFESYKIYSFDSIGFSKSNGSNISTPVTYDEEFIYNVANKNGVRKVIFDPINAYFRRPEDSTADDIENIFGRNVYPSVHCSESGGTISSLTLKVYLVGYRSF